MHCRQYNVGNMSDTSLQLTIRGLDAATKQALVKKARRQGMSLNRYALESLKQSAGVSPAEERYQRLKAFIDKHGIPADEMRNIQEAITWGKRASLDKQRRDEHDLSL